MGGKFAVLRRAPMQEFLPLPRGRASFEKAKQKTEQKQAFASNSV
jgi:hypothetical protein